MTYRRSAPFALIALFAAVPFALPFARNEILVFRDHLDYFAPLRYFTAGILRGGRLPLWNPYSGLGERWMANPQTGVFYPPAWILVVLPFARGYLSFLWFHLALLGAGAFLFFRTRASENASLLGAVWVMLTGPTLSLLDINNNLASFAWVPLVLWCAVDRRSETPRPLALSVFVLAFAFLGGEPLVAAIAFLAFAAIVLWRRARAAGEVAVTILMALLLASIQIVPFLELVVGSDRSSGLNPALAFAQSSSLRDWLMSVVSPAVRGAGFLPLSQNFIPSIYLGIPLVACVALAFLGGDRRSRKVDLAWLGGALILAVAAAGRTIPGAERVLLLLHLNVSRYPARFLPFAAFCLIAVAVSGADCLSKVSRQARSAVFGGVVLLAIVSAPLWLDSVATRSDLGEPLAFALLGMAVLVGRPAILKGRMPLAVLVLTTVDLWWGGQAFLRSDRFQPVSGPYTQISRSDGRIARLDLKLQVGSTNPFSRTAWLSAYLNLYDRVFDLSTPAPVVPSGYERFVEAAIGGRRDLLDFAGTRFVLTFSPVPLPGMVRLRQNGLVTLSQNQNALPAVSLWGDYREVSSDEEALHLMIDEHYNPRHAVILTSPPAGYRVLHQLGREPGKFDLRYSISDDGVRASLGGSRPVLLVVTQNDARGWIARIDGHPVPTVRCNGLFRAVFVPAGKHEVRWTYEPASLRIGTLLTLLGILAVGGSAVVERRVREEKHVIPSPQARELKVE